MGRGAKKRAYVVTKGRKLGIFNTWDECKEQTDGYSGCSHTGYVTRELAEEAWAKFLQSESPTISTLSRPNTEDTHLNLPVLSLSPNMKRTVSLLDASEGDFPASKKIRLERVAVADIPSDNFPPVVLTLEQEAAVRLALDGNNMFLTGAAGSGKTVTLKEIKRRLISKHGAGTFSNPTVQIVAPTGIAALPLDGKITYSFAGWTPDSFKQPMKKLLENVKKNTRKRINRLEVLIVEEISMVENHHLERLNMLFQNVMGRERPFGGKQVICVGDFHQLPPVLPFQSCLFCGEDNIIDDESYTCSADCKHAERYKLGDKWSFKAPVWTELHLRNVMLEQIHRQKDTSFQDILNKVRDGIELTDGEWNSLTQRKEVPPDKFIVRLMSLKHQVNKFNGTQLKQIDSRKELWQAIDSSRKLYSTDEDDPIELQNRCSEYLADLDHRLEKTLVLKIGAKVVLLHNQNPAIGLVNGSQGEVVGFLDTKNSRRVEVKGTNAEWRQELIDDYKKTNSLEPVVLFQNGKRVAVPVIANDSLIGPSYDRYLVCRTQIPLALGWALSIHKSQGMTLENVEVSSLDIFESGQLYVALSRATSLEGLTLTGFLKEQLPIDPDVLHFYRTTEWDDLRSSGEKSLGAEREVENVEYDIQI